MSSRVFGDTPDDMPAAKRGDFEGRVSQTRSWSFVSCSAADSIRHEKKNSCTFQLHPALDVTTAVKFMRRFLFSRIFGPSHQQLNWMVRWVVLPYTQRSLGLNPALEYPPLPQNLCNATYFIGQPLERLTNIEKTEGGKTINTPPPIRIYLEAPIKCYRRNMDPSDLKMNW